MWILHQDGTAIVNTEFATEIYVNDNRIGAYIMDEAFVLGEYQTSDTAQEVFSHIIANINSEKNIYRMPVTNF